MSDTPETDREEIVMGRTECDRYVLAEFSRRLERERDKARTELEMWRDGNIMHQIHRDELEKTERERDEARDIIRKAIMKFSEDDSDGRIAAAMLAILSKKEPVS